MKNHRFTVISLVSLFLVTGCATAHRSLTADDVRVRALGSEIQKAQKESPNLPAFKEVSTLSSSAFANRSESEKALLAGRLYYDAARSIADGTGDVRQVLADDRSPEKYNRAYFDRLISDSQSRAATDADYRRAIDHSSAQARSVWVDSWNDIDCYVDGFPAASWECRVLLIGVWFTD